MSFPGYGAAPLHRFGGICICPMGRDTPGGLYGSWIGYGCAGCARKMRFISSGTWIMPAGVDSDPPCVVTDGDIYC